MKEDIEGSHVEQVQSIQPHDESAKELPPQEEHQDFQPFAGGPNPNNIDLLHALHQAVAAVEYNRVNNNKPLNQSLPPPHHSESSDHSGDHTHEAPPPHKNNQQASSLKLSVTCNDVRGIVMLDQQIIACYCDHCSQRVVAGYDRPLFSFTRFERHSGSKSKKWRLSIRIDPGTVPECPLGESPLPLGQWLELRGMNAWAPRVSKVGPRDLDSDIRIGSDSTIYDANGWALYDTFHAQQRPPRNSRYPFSNNAANNKSNIIGNTQRLQYGHQFGAEESLAPPLPAKRPRLMPSTTEADGDVNEEEEKEKKERKRDYDTPDPLSFPREGETTWLLDHCTTFDTAAAQDTGDIGMRHNAIFRLVYALLARGEERILFSEEYLPWLNDIARQRIDIEFCTLHAYLKMVPDVGAQAVAGMVKGYIRSILRRLTVDGQQQ